MTTCSPAAELDALICEESWIVQFETSYEFLCQDADGFLTTTRLIGSAGLFESERQAKEAAKRFNMRMRPLLVNVAGIPLVDDPISPDGLTKASEAGMKCPSCEHHLGAQDYENEDPFDCRNCGELIRINIDEGTYFGATHQTVEIVERDEE